MLMTSRRSGWLFALALAGCATGSPHETHRAPAAPITFTAQGALDGWLAPLRAESPGCSITVNAFTADYAQVTFRDAHPPAEPANAPPMQIPRVDYIFVQPFVPEAVVAARREALAKRVADCMADAGPGHHVKGRDMNAEGCVLMSRDDQPLPSFHLDQELSAELPAYFQAPAVCDAAAAAFKARWTAYP